MTTIFQNIINQHTQIYKQKPDFCLSYEILEVPYVRTEVLKIKIQYTETGVRTFHRICFNSTGKPVLSTGLEERIVDHNTGEIIFEFYGSQNEMFYEILENLQAEKRAFDIYIKNRETSYPEMKQIKKIGNTSFHQLKTGKWSGRF